MEEKLEWILKQRNTRMTSPSPSESPKDYRRKMENYQRILTEKLSVLIPKWESATGLHATQWKLRDMKTRWGSCTPSSGRIRLNLQLAAYPTLCLEYVIVHELVHLKIPGHPKNSGKQSDTISQNIKKQEIYCARVFLILPRGTESGTFPGSHPEFP